MALTRDLQQRDINLMSCEKFRLKHQVGSGFIDRLGLERVLKGHGSCVNCLQWSNNGQILASGSDDVKIILWDPFKGVKKQEILTQHKGNIFSVKFMPHTDDRFIASCAGDSQIMLHDVTRGDNAITFSSHFGRVKRLEVAQDCPNLLWSASEDGTIMETDIRAPPTDTNILINLLSILGRGAEAKCLSINPRRPELLAVGVNDPFVRVYDRRRIKAQLVDFPAEMRTARGRTVEKKHFISQVKPSFIPPLSECAQYYVPGHLPRKSEDVKRQIRSFVSTYVTFSPDGKELLVNLGSEQIYLYDMANCQKSLVQRIDYQKLLNPSQDSICDNCRHCLGISSPPSTSEAAKKTSETVPKIPDFPTDIESDKLAANFEFEQKRYSNAISIYNSALRKFKHPILFGNRAAAFLKRKWEGDLYASLMDCCEAIKMDPSYIKAYLRMIRCLIELKWTFDADACLSRFKDTHPQHAKGQLFLTMEKEIKDLHKEANNRRNGGPLVTENAAGTHTLFVAREFVMPQESDSDDSAETVINEPDESESGAQESQEQKLPAYREKDLRKSALDYSTRFCGHCNTTTDIKEANFFGGNGEYIVAGSDDGKFFCWEKSSGNIVRVLQGDKSIVNCLQSHPTSCMLATSGIDPVVRIWGPLPEDGKNNEYLVTDYDQTTSANQRRMNSDPFETILMNMGFRVRTGNADPNAATAEAESAESSSAEEETVHCRTS